MRNLVLSLLVSLGSGCVHNAGAQSEGSAAELSKYTEAVKRRVSPNWNPHLDARKTTLLTRVKSRLQVRVRADGTLKDVAIEQSSGVPWLDQLGVRAFEVSQPFGRVPQGLLDLDGSTRFAFEFEFRVDESGASVDAGH